MDKQSLLWYWRAHWDLPSPTQGYEMLHRLNPEVLKVRGDAYREMGLEPAQIQTDLETLRSLLKTADYPKFWRDRLIAIAYSPLTRVDLRRIYQLGLIGDEELIARLMELGYTKKDAELLLAFFKRLRHEESFKLAISKIERAFKIGKINREEYKRLLLDSGYSEEEAEFLVSLTELEISEEKKERLVNLLTAKLAKGLITEKEFWDELKRLGIGDEEIRYWLEVAKVKREIGIKTLSTAQIKEAYTKGIITEDEALDLLLASNWDKGHAILLLEIWKKDIKKKAGK